MNRGRVLAVAVSTSGLFASVGPAHANGRFPATTSIAPRRGHPGSFVAGATFGMLLSTDDGAHVWWVCEDAIGYNGVFDPHWAVATDGTIYATISSGLAVSRDGGCTFSLATLPAPALERIPAERDVSAIDLGPNDEVWITTSDGALPNDVYESPAGGGAFQSKGLRATGTWWTSVKVAPSNAARVYVTGYQTQLLEPDGGTAPAAADLMRSDDAGVTWQPMPVSDITFANDPKLVIVAVSTANPDIVFAVSVAVNSPTGDRLYRSTDGASTWQPVLDTTDAIRDVVIRSDGQVLAATALGGAFLAPTTGSAFAPIASPPQMACAADRGDGVLYACGANYDPDHFALGRSTDASHWTKVFDFASLTGPLACPAGTVQHDDCALQMWPMIVSQLGVTTIDAGLPMAPPVDARGSGTGKGCCDASSEAPPLTVVAVTLLALHSRRERRASARPRR